MTKWDYLVAYSSDLSKIDEEEGEDSLDKLGAEGWELTAVDSGIFYFKRPIGTNDEKPSDMKQRLKRAKRNKS